MVGPPG
ncbi:hypothetical protein ECEC1864_1078, partial [Escherichia coli EC1864]